MSGLRISRGDLLLPLDVLTEAVGIIATRGAGKTYGSVVLIEEAYDASVPFVVLDPTGVYHGLRSSADGKRDGLPVYVLGGPRGDLPLEDGSGSFLADLVVESGHSFVFDLSDFSKTKARSWVAVFLERLYERKARERTTLLLVVDEADEFAPQKARGESARVLGAMEQIVKRGRSRGIGAVLISQRTQAINKDVLDLIDTLIALRVVAPRGRDAVRDWIVAKEAEDEKGVIGSLNSLATGEAWLWSPVRGLLEKFTFRRIRTFDSYATPKPGEVRVEPKKRKALDLDALGERMQETVERAKENDPTELRKRLRRAEQLAVGAREMEETLDAVREAFNSQGENAAEWLVNIYQGVAHALELPSSADVVDEVRALANGKPILSEDDLFALNRFSHVIEENQAETVSAYNELRKVLDPLAANVREELQRRQRPAARPPNPPYREPVRPPTDPVRKATDQVRQTRLNGGDPLSGPEQRVLDALAWFEAMRVNQPTRIQVGFVAGYKVGKKGGGTFAQVIADMTKKGLIEQGRGTLTLTPQGRAEANDPGLAATNAEMQRAVLARLSESEARVLSVLIREHPDDISRIDLGTECGYTVTAKGGGTFAQLVANLVTLGLVDKTRPGHVRALDVLFPLG